MKLSMGAAWSRVHYAGCMLKMVMTTPPSDRKAWFMTGAYALCLILAGLIIAMSIALPTPLSAFWIGVNTVLSTFYATMLYWSLLGLMDRREQRRMDREFERIAITFEY